MSPELIAIVAVGVALGTAMLASMRSLRTDLSGLRTELRTELGTEIGGLQGHSSCALVEGRRRASQPSVRRGTAAVGTLPQPNRPRRAPPNVGSCPSCAPSCQRCSGG